MTLRRSFLRAAGAMALASLWPDASFGSGRTPYGGRVTFRMPWPLARIDPHRIDDVTAALVGDALFDTLYVPDDAGAFRPSLAEGDPEPVGSKLRIRVRTGARFASGMRLDAQAIGASIERARLHDAAAWLSDVPPARIEDDALVFSIRDARALVRALASPLVSVVPPRFSPERPEGSGPFRAALRSGGLELTRNTIATNGPAFLDAIAIEEAPDLTASLRAFESGADDIGWLGSFLHEPRTGARSFDGGAVAWAILRTGAGAGSLDVPGTAQSLANGVRYAALQPLVVGPPWSASDAPWSGPPSDLCVRDDAPWLVDVARALAAALSSPSHEITARPLAAVEIAQRRANRAFALMLDVARPAGPGDLGALLGLAMASDTAAAIALARHPPRGSLSLRTVTRTMRIGVVGEIRVQGGRVADLVLPPSTWGRGLDWGGAFRLRGGARA